jgi:hypothetical protein
VIRGSDPEIAWFRIQFVPWIQIQEGKKAKKKREEEKEISRFEELEVISGVLQASPRAWLSFI